MFIVCVAYTCVCVVKYVFHFSSVEAVASTTTAIPTLMMKPEEIERLIHEIIANKTSTPAPPVDGPTDLGGDLKLADERGFVLPDLPGPLQHWSLHDWMVVLMLMFLCVVAIINGE